MNKKQLPMIVYMVILITCILIISIIDFNYESEFLHNKIESYVKENCKNKDTCYLFLKDITDFEWDKFYIVPIGADINKILGFEYPFFYRDLLETFVFLKDRKIIYHYENPYEVSWNFEVIPEKYTFCESVDSCQIKNYLLFSPEEANFFVEVWWSERIKKNLYHLYPIAH